MSNFKYLIIVNKYAGRSYLDPANYPVFPWVVTNYNSNKVGFPYRDLSKSVGALVSITLFRATSREWTSTSRSYKPRTHSTQCHLTSSAHITVLPGWSSTSSFACNPIPKPVAPCKGVSLTYLIVSSPQSRSASTVSFRRCQMSVN